MNTLSSISYYFTGNIVLATDMIHYYSSGTIYNEGSSSQSSLTTVGDKDIIGMLIDTDAKTVQFYVNGTASGTAETMANTTDPVAAQLHGHNSRPFMFNFGTDSSFANRKTSGSANATDANGIGDFYYTPPTGAKAICSENLPEPSISPVNGEQPADYFNTVLYTGNGSTQSITGVGFQPEWVWLKSRTSVYDHTVYDVIRGATYKIAPNDEYASSADADTLTSFDSDGFSLGDDVKTNASSGSMVSWNWLAGGSAVSNTDGDITSSVSANTKAGFSIAKYTGDGTATTIGHGLDSAPEMYMIKNISSTDNWVVYHKDLTSASYYLTLDTTNAEVSNNVVFNGTDPTSTVFSVGTSRSTNGDNYIAYCFHSVPGYSKVGSHKGNGSTNGVFVHCGFRPAWVMVKSYDNTRNWTVFDSKRTPNNEMDGHLHPNASVAEQTGAEEIDFLSNGFKFRSGDADSNYSNFDYIYLAFAEQPFKYSNAR